MNLPFVLFAALNGMGDLPVEVGASRRAPGRVDDVLLIVGLALGMLVVLVLWAKFIRRPRREDADPSRVLKAACSDNPKEGAGNRRRRTRQRYPTLAEKGGLPPVRENSSSGDAHHAG